MESTNPDSAINKSTHIEQDEQWAIGETFICSYGVGVAGLCHNIVRTQHTHYTLHAPWTMNQEAGTMKHEAGSNA